MCILEKEQVIDSQSLQLYNSYCREIAIKDCGHIIAWEENKIVVPLILTLRRNPTLFLPEIKYVCDHLNLVFPIHDLYKMTALFLNKNLACPKALETMSISRKKYFQVTYIIGERLSGYHNYLANAAFENRIPKWIKNNRKLIKTLMKSFDPGNDFIAVEYLKMVNEDIKFKSNNRNKKALNKIPISVLSETRTYISRHLITYVGAILWFRWTPKGKIKSNMLKELAIKTATNYVEDKDLMDVKEPYKELTKYIMSDNNRDAQKAIKEYKYNASYTRVLSVNKNPEKRVNYINRREETAYRKVRSVDFDQLDIESAIIYKRWNKYLYEGKINQSDKEAKLLNELSKSPCQKKHFLMGFIWEELYSKLGNIQSDVGLAMRRKRLILANKGIYLYRVQLDMDELDRLMHYEIDTASPEDLPQWLVARKYFFFNNNYYPSKSEYIAAKTLLKIKQGNYVNVFQLYKNNAISSRFFITSTLLQRVLRKRAKKDDIRVFDKHAFKCNIINDCKQQFKDLMTYSHNARRFEAVSIKYVEEYINSGFYISNSDLKQKGDKFLEDTTTKRLAKWDQMSPQRSFKSKQGFFEKNAGDLPRAISALNDIQRYRMSLEDFGDRFSTIRDYLTTVPRITTVSPRKDIQEGFNCEMMYPLAVDPVTSIFMNRLIKYLIRFIKIFKVSNSYQIEHRRINSKPIRQVEEMLVLRYRALWDLRETGRIYLKQEQWHRGSALNPAMADWIDSEYSKLTSAKLVQAFRSLAPNSGSYREKESMNKLFKTSKPLTESYQYTVAKMFSVQDYLFHKTEYIEELFGTLVVAEKKKKKKKKKKPSEKKPPADTELSVLSEGARSQVLTYGEASSLIEAISANPLKGQKKKSKKKKRKDRSYETVTALFDKPKDDDDQSRSSKV
jgi:hypothetical protein